MQATVLNKAMLMETLRSHGKEIRSFGVNSLGLFGSFVRNSGSDESDIDLLVDFEPNKKTFDNFMELSFFLEQLFGRKVDLVTRQSLSKYIGPYILSELENVSF